jgi:hypothetical protein
MSESEALALTSDQFATLHDIVMELLDESDRRLVQILGWEYDQTFISVDYNHLTLNSYDEATLPGSDDACETLRFPEELMTVTENNLDWVTRYRAILNARNWLKKHGQHAPDSSIELTIKRRLLTEYEAEPSPTEELAQIMTRLRNEIASAESEHHRWEENVAKMTVLDQSGPQFLRELEASAKFKVVHNHQLTEFLEKN